MLFFRVFSTLLSDLFKPISYVNDDGALDPIESDDETKPEIPNNSLILYRTYYETGTHGELVFPDGEVLFTLENPWLDNKRHESCVPEGTYSLLFRESPLVSRLTMNDHTFSYELMNVEGRSNIIFHQGNYVKNTDGCILLGNRLDFQYTTPVVWQSRPTFDKFIQMMHNNPQINKILIIQKDANPYHLSEVETL